ncbi:phage tail tape measure protein [Xenorhabdus bovienii]|uniref:phage tail tape measure protein n=2 Tax=Xenorhabdus bovienii TaxID=40576 RepID=UPI0023B32C58|nr:tape measure protein [Xenorhabdus bovienii]
MAKLRELIIKISANSASFQSEIARASRLGADYYRTMEKGGRQAASASRNSQQAMRELNGQLASVRDTAKGMAGAFAGMFATGRLISMADGYNSLNARIKLATTSTEDFKNAQQGLLRISQYTGSTFESNASLFTRVSASLREYGYSTKDILSLTDSLATGLQVSGASAEETSSLIVQLSQALGRGVLRGQDFNSVAQSGQRIMKALSDGLGVAQKDLKQLADAGELTTPKIVPALVSQLQKMREEFDSMPNSVSAASTRVTNAFQQWIGGANQTTSATATLSGVLDGIAKNMDTVAAAGMVAVGLFGARALGNRVSAIGASTAALIQNSRAEINNADQAYRNSQVQVASARASVRQAQQNVIAARSRMLQTTTTQTFAAAEARLNRTLAAAAAAQARVTQSINARAAAQARLNAVTSLGSRLMGGALGLVGGIPGLAILAGSALYFMHQKQEQAKQSALELRNSTELLTESLKEMSSLEVKKRVFDTQDQITEQKDAIEEQKKLVAARQADMELSQRIANTNVGKGSTRILETLAERTRIYNNEVNNLALMQEGLSHKQKELNLLQSRQSGLLRDNYVEMLNTRDILPMLTLAGSDFNRILSVGNRLLQERTTLTSVPFALPQTPLNDKQKDFLKKSARDLELSALQGVERVKRQAEFAAEDQELNTPQYQDYYQKYINNSVAAYQNGEKAKEAQAAAAKATSEAAKAAREAASAQENYRNKVDELNTQLATEAIRYKEGSAAAELFAASMASGKSFTQAQNSEISRLNQTLEEAKQKYQDLQDAISNDPFRNTAESAKKAREQLERQFKNKDVTPEEYGRRKDDIWRDEVRGNTSARQQYAVSAREDLRGEVDPIQDLDNQLARKKALYDTYAETQIISEQRKNELIIAADNETNERRYEAAMQLYASQGRIQKMTVNLFVVTQERMSNILTGMLTGTQSFKDGMISLFSSLTQSIIQNLMDMAAQAIITNLILKSIMGVAGGVVGGASGGTTLANGQAVPMPPKNISALAKGGVFSSPSLSAYSGQIVSSPTFFAFAKGAGLMGEAGPEAIMPLTRAADGSLGVRALMPAGVSAGTAPQVSIVINDKGSDSTSSPGWEQFGSEIGRSLNNVIVH